MVDVIIPEVGESITEGVLVEWFKEDGAFVEADDLLFDLETDKITLSVEAEEAGVLKVLVPADLTVKVGQKVGEIDTKARAKEKPVSTPAGMAQAVITIDRLHSSGSDDKKVPSASIRSAEITDAFSPAVRRLVEEHGVDTTLITGSGKGERLTKEDILEYLKRPKAQAPKTVDSKNRQTRKPMSPMRKRIAEKLLSAQQNAAILTTFNEIDMTRVIEMRAQFQDAFVKKYNVKLGFMSFFVKGVVDALKAVPEVGAQIQGDEIVYNNYYDIGVAVGTDKGLVVPVLREADKLSFAGIEQGIAHLAKKATSRSLTLDDLSGGVFTISNGGIYGNLLSTPIINPPQSGVLGMHAIKKRPMVVEDEIKIRPMMYIALSYDHRIVDGKEAVTFLAHIKDCVEQAERILLEI